MYPTWFRSTTRKWTTALFLLVIMAALIGGAQHAAAQPPPPDTPDQPTRLMLPLMMNTAAGTGQNQLEPQPEPEVVFMAAPSPSGATVASDLPDYPPGALVTLTGAGWAPGEAVHIIVNDDVGQSWSYSSAPDPIAGEDGAFTHQVQLPSWFVANYGVVAAGPISGQASTTFTDLSIGTYDQCSNDDGDGYATGDTGCRWINGNLQPNNSTYFEGDATVQRVWLTELPAGPHSITLQYGTTKGGKHAYDYLTNWNWSESWISAADLCEGIANCTSWPVSTLPIPDDPNVPNTIEPVPGPRVFTMYNGTLTTASPPQIESGSYAGDSETIITVSFNVNPATAKNCATKQGVTTCSVALFFGAHVSSQADWGIGQGAGSISGSPYHVALYRVDGASVGQRDNQMQANAVTPNGTVILKKDAVPDDPQNFSFNLNNGSTISQNFALDDDGDPTLPNSQTFSVPPGVWSASELGLPVAGWDFTSLVCSDPTNNTTVSGAQATINLASLETVTCTFTNTKRGAIVVKKNTTGGDGTFDFTTTGGGGFPASFSITTAGGTGAQTYNNIVPGAYSVAESPLAGWTLTGSACDSGTPGSFTVPPGGTVTCTFANTRTYNKDLTVSKTAVASLARTYQWLIDKSVDDTRIEIAAGATATFNYTVKVQPDGFVDSGWTVGGKITVANANSFAIEGVTVTDAIDNGGACTVAGGTNVTVPANGSVVLDYSCTYAAAPTAAAGANTATAAWNKATYDTPNGSAEGKALVDFSTAALAETYRSITVADDKTDPANPVTLGTSDYYAGPFAFTYALAKQGTAGQCVDYTNTAVIDETGQTDAQTVTVCVGQDLAATKTAVPSFSRTWNWTITKVSDATYHRFAGESVTHGYKVAVTPTAADGGWKVVGTITIVNPNAWQAITANVGDTVNNGGACALDDGAQAQVSVPAGGSLLVNYTCTWASAPSTAQGINTASITWDAAAFATPSGAASATKPFEFGAPADEVNPVITVDDSNLTGESWSADRAYAEWPYTRDFACPSDPAKYVGDGTYSNVFPNTATIEQTGASASAAVTLNCYAPVVSKTAAGTYDERHTWDVAKTALPAQQSAFAGATVAYEWQVVVTEQTSEENFDVAGAITVQNPAPQAMTVALADVLSDATAAAIGPCTNGATYADGSLTIPASSTTVCAYTANDLPYTNAAAAPTGNNVTATLNGIAFTAHQPIGWTANVIGASATLDDDQNAAWPVTLNEGGTFTYADADGYECPSDPAAYAEDGIAPVYTDRNTATIAYTGGSDSSTATTSVTCYAPVVSKTAAAEWRQKYAWTIAKAADPAAHSGFAGDTFTSAYAVSVDQTVTDYGFVARGTITLQNPAGSPGSMSIDVADMVSGGFAATVDCNPGAAGNQGSVVVPAGETATCTYAAALPDNASRVNTATATFNAIGFLATADVIFGAPIVEGFPTITVADTVQGDLGTAGGDKTFTYVRPFSCATDSASYTDYADADVYGNTATIEETGASADAAVAVNCYIPQISKTADGVYVERHEWDIAKTVLPATQNAFAGDKVSYEWTVTVAESVFEEGFVASGKITVKNHNPQDAMTVTLTDVLSDNTAAAISACTGDSNLADGLTIAGGSTSVCDYSVALPYTALAAAPTSNTAKAVLNGIAYQASDPIEWAASVVRGSATVDDDQNSAFPLEISDGGTWRYTEQYTCSTTRTDYGATSFKSVFGESNTAIVTSGGERDRATAATEVNCYWPQIDLAKSGDALSKIGDKVYYDITASNNTPADLGLRALACTIGDAAIGFNKTVTLASGAADANLDIGFTIPATAADPFVNTASLSCSPTGSTFSVSDSAAWSTNLFQPKVEIVKTGPAYATAGDTVTYAFTIKNLSSSDSPDLILDTLADDKLGDLAAAAPTACDALAPGASCTFTVDHTAPDVGLQPTAIKNIVTAHYHPAGFPNDIWDDDDHTVLVTPKSQLTDTSFCPLANNQFRLLYHLETTPNIYRLQASNPGQYYFNGFYFGAPGSDFTMNLQVAYPFVTQENIGNPIQVHDGTSLTGGGCYSPNPSLGGFTIKTQAMVPTSSAGNQIITPEDYTTKQIGQYTTVTVSGKVPATGMVYVTIHLDYGLKRTGSWKLTGTSTLNPVSNLAMPDVNNASGFGSGPVTILGYQPYSFARSVGSDVAPTNPSSYNEIKKFAGFLGFVTDTGTGKPLGNVKITIYDPANKLLTTQYTDADGYYMYAYKHTAKSATYTVKVPAYNKAAAMTVKANGFAAVDFEVQALAGALAQDGGDEVLTNLLYLPMIKP